jgi:hypothetical protein
MFDIANLTPPQMHFLQFGSGMPAGAGGFEARLAYGRRGGYPPRNKALLVQSAV